MSAEFGAWDCSIILIFPRPLSLSQMPNVFLVDMTGHNRLASTSTISMKCCTPAMPEVRGEFLYVIHFLCIWFNLFWLLHVLKNMFRLLFPEVSLVA